MALGLEETRCMARQWTISKARLDEMVRKEREHREERIQVRLGIGIISSDTWSASTNEFIGHT